jgi:Spy/CpxP family protein refolding chaperone
VTPPLAAPLAAVRWLLLVLLLGLIGVPVCAQGLEWWRNGDVQRQLRLTPGQTDTIDRLVAGTLPKRRALRSSLDRLEAALEQAIGRDDEPEALALIPKVEAARAARNRERTLLLLRIYRVLTVEQRRELSRIQARRRERAAPR